MMRKVGWYTLATTVILMTCVTILRPDWLVMPPTLDDLKVSALGCSDKCAEPSDPNRPSYDEWGNEFDYKGNLIKAGTCVSGNPYCKLQAVLNNYGTTSSNGDLNGDGKVNVLDLSVALTQIQGFHS